MNAQIDSFENWDEIRTAYHVARLGTLSAAAAHLGVHHATVIRHIDALEAQLGSKLFQRHARGYSPTEAGLELMQVAGATEDQFSMLANRLKGRSAEVSGDLVVTTLSGLSPQLTPLLVEFGALHPDVRLTLLADERPLKLEYGEAHVALRAGPKPTESDNVVQHVSNFPVAMFAHQDYVARYGPLTGDVDLPNHRFVSGMSSGRRAPFSKWMTDNIPESAIAFRGSDMRSVEDAIHAGAGIGFLSLWSGQSNPDLVQINATNSEWDSPLWLVTHVDLHRTAKVQALLGFLKENLISRIKMLKIKPKG